MDFRGCRIAQVYLGVPDMKGQRRLCGKFSKAGNAVIGGSDSELSGKSGCNGGSGERMGLSRRDFIAAAATTGAAALFSGSERLFAAGSDKIRVGLIGCGECGNYGDGRFVQRPSGRFAEETQRRHMRKDKCE